MLKRPKPLLSLGLLAAAMGTLASAGGAGHSDTESELEQRLQKEQNPVKASKYAARLARLKLEQAKTAYDEDRMDDGQKLLDAYVGLVQRSWEALKTSGRDAARKSQGFRELDLALRGDSRTLVDLEHRVPYADREPVTHTAQIVDSIRSEVLMALFPGAAPNASQKSAPSQAQQNGGPGK